MKTHRIAISHPFSLPAVTGHSAIKHSKPNGFNSESADMEFGSRSEGRLDVSDLVQLRAEHLGPEGLQWLDALPGVIAGIESDWSISVVEPLDGATTAFVARVQTKNGRYAVLKIAMPDPGFDDQIRTLAQARGNGYVGLLEHDIKRRAMLQESLGLSMRQLNLPPERALKLLCATLRQAWRLPTERLLVREPVRKAEGLAELVRNHWEGLGKPCSRAVIDQALRYAERRAKAHDANRNVVVHGDPHIGNALAVLSLRRGAESGYVFVDPDGFLEDPAYDLGVVLRDWCVELKNSSNSFGLARGFSALLARETGVDETAIWEWGYLERVSTGLFVTATMRADVGRPYLDTAEMLVGS